MERDMHAAILADILQKREDQAVVSDNLTKLSEDYAGMLADSTLTKAENDALKKRNQELAEQNMKLFLKIGKVPDPEPEPDGDKPKLTYDALFDDKGKLK